MIHVHLKRINILGKDMEKRDPCWWEGKMVKPLWKTAWRFLEKNKTTTGSNIPTSGYLSRENEKTNLKKYMHPMFTVALCTMAKKLIQPMCPSMN